MVATGPGRAMGMAQESLNFSRLDESSLNLYLEKLVFLLRGSRRATR
jgi:hypothetical protein